jgi:flagellar hook-associated protein 1 FlgK
MADLLSILNNASASLAAQREAAATASQNIANANTPGYARQTANLEALTPTQFVGNAFIGRGVGVQSITQSRDQFIERQLPSATAAQASSSTESDALSAISALDPQSPNGLSSALSAFYSAMRAVAQNPADVPTRQAALGATQALTSAFNTTSQSLEAARTGLDTQIDGTIQQANSDASGMASLNTQIRMARASGAEPNDLLDARQRLQDDLTKLTGATPVTNTNGDISMALPGGTALVSDDRAAQLSSIADPTNSGHLSLRLTRADGSGPIALANSAAGGTLGGSLAARDTDIGAASTALDTLAFNFANAANAVQSTGFALDGTTGHPMFTVGATSAGAAAQIAVDPTLAGNSSLLAAASTAAGAPGDNTNLSALIATEQSALPTGGNPGATFAGIVAQFGGVSQRASAMSAQDGSILDNLSQLRESTSGVSIDEEMVNLTAAQNAFDAMSKVITTASTMFDTLMTLTATV